MTLVCYSWSTTYVRRRLRWASCLSLSICLCMYVHWAGVEPEGLCEAVVTNKYQHETPAAQQVRRPTGLRAAKFKISGFPAVCPFSNFPPSSPRIKAVLSIVKLVAPIRSSSRPQNPRRGIAASPGTRYTTPSPVALEPTA